MATKKSTKKTKKAVAPKVSGAGGGAVRPIAIIGFGLLIVAFVAKILSLLLLEDVAAITWLDYTEIFALIVGAFFASFALNIK
jgi:hypothetical protein